MSCFSFQTRKDLVPVTFCYNAAVQRFLKTFRKFAGRRLWWKLFSGKLKLCKTDSGKGFFISLPNTFLWLLPNTEQKHVPLNDHIVWCKYSRVIKDLSKSGSLFLLNAPKYLGARLSETFLYSQRARFYVFSEMYSSQKKTKQTKKNPWNLKGFIAKAKTTPH